MKWTRSGSAFACVLLTAVMCAAQGPQQSAAMEDASRLRKLTMGLMIYMQEHADQMPPDLMALAPYLTGDLTNAKAKQREGAIREAFMTAQDHDIRVPTDVDAEWLAKNSSYAYLPGPGLKSADLAEWDRLAVVHLKFDKGLATEPSPHAPGGRLYTVSFMDSHIELLPREEAEAVVAESMAVYDAIRSGKPLPAAFQAVMDVRVIMAAVREYAQRNGGMLPPDLGSVLEFIPVDGKRVKTNADRARVFLSPDAKATTHVPDEPTPEWVNARASYVYLGAAGVSLEAIEDPMHSVLIHGKLDLPMEYASRGAKMEGIVLGTASGAARIQDAEYSRWIVDVSRRLVSAIKDGTPLPDHLNAYRDVRLLLGAIQAYSRKNDGRLPGDIGEVLPFVLPDMPVGERAAAFLSPKAERSTGMPEAITPEWVQRYGSYAYLGEGGVDLKLVREAGAEMFIHSPPDEAFEIRVPGAQLRSIVIGFSYGYPWFEQVDQARERSERSRQTIEDMKAALEK